MAPALGLRGKGSRAKGYSRFCGARAPKPILPGEGSSASCGARAPGLGSSRFCGARAPELGLFEVLRCKGPELRLFEVLQGKGSRTRALRGFTEH